MTFDRITRDPAVQGGRPCVRDTGVSVGSILGWMLNGRTRAELLADHPGLESADFDQAFDFVKQQLRANELPDVEVGGRVLSPAELSAVRAPDEVGERLGLLIRREKNTGVTPAELAELDDLMRIDHLFTLAKVRAKSRLMTPVG